MYVFVAAILIILLTVLAGVLVFFIIHHTYAISDNQSAILDTNTHVTDIKTNIVSDETSNQGNFANIAQALLDNKTRTNDDRRAIADANAQITAAKSLIADNSSAFASLTNGMKVNLQSNRMLFNTPTTSTLGDALSLSTTGPSTFAATNPPSDSKNWLQATDKSSTKYVNLGVGSMWSDTGIQMSKGACVNFGNNANMCGNQTGAVAVGGHASIGSNLTIGNSPSVGAGMLSSASASHLYSGMDSTTYPSTAAMSLGFAHRLPSSVSPAGGSDVIQMTRQQQVGNNVKILGSLQVCDDMGTNCSNVSLVPGPPPTQNFHSDNQTYQNWSG